MVEVKSARIKDYEMDYMVFGEGKRNLVILPGLSIHSVMRLSAAVEDAYSSFSPYYKVYLIEQRRSIPEGYTVPDLASDTASLLSSLSPGEWDIMGFSFGGMIALSLLVSYPFLFRRAVLGSTTAKADGTFSTVVENWIEKAEARDEEGLISSFMNHVYSPSTIEKYGETIKEGEKGITEDEYRRFIKQAQLALSYDLSESLGQVKTPSFVIGAECDGIIPLSSQKETAEALHASSYFYPSPYGHAVYDEAGDYKERCLGFFNNG